MDIDADGDEAWEELALHTIDDNGLDKFKNGHSQPLPILDDSDEFWEELSFEPNDFVIDDHCTDEEARREALAGSPQIVAKVLSTDSLHPGDHVLYRAAGPPYRTFFKSAIVESLIKNEESSVMVIENCDGGVQIRKIIQQTSPQNCLYQVFYSKCRFSNEESVERAKRRCEWKEDAFHPIFNNSHFFASWAKTGLEYPLTDLLLQLELEDQVDPNSSFLPVFTKNEINAINPGDHIFLPNKTPHNWLVSESISEMDKLTVTAYSFDGKAVVKSSFVVNQHSDYFIGYEDSIPVLSCDVSLERARKFEMKQAIDLDKTLTFPWKDSCEFVKAMKSKSSSCSLGEGVSFQVSEGSCDNDSADATVIEPGDHIHIPYLVPEHWLVETIDLQTMIFTGYSFNTTNFPFAKRKIVKQTHQLEGESYLIRYTCDKDNLATNRETLLQVETKFHESQMNDLEINNADWQNCGQFVTEMKTGTKFNVLEDELLIPSYLQKLNCTRVGKHIIIKEGDHLVLKMKENVFSSLLVYKCIGEEDIITVPSLDGKQSYGHVHMGNQEIYRINYAHGLQAVHVFNRTHSAEGKQVFVENNEDYEYFITWAKTGTGMKIDIPELLAKGDHICQLRPTCCEKLFSSNEIEVGDHLVEWNAMYWIHMMVTESTSSTMFKVIYQHRGYVQEEIKALNPHKSIIYRVLYDESFPTDTSIERARAKLKTANFSPYARMEFITTVKTGLEDGIDIDLLRDKSKPLTKSKITVFSQLNLGDYMVRQPTLTSGELYWHHYLITEIHSPTECSVIETWNLTVTEHRITCSEIDNYYRVNYGSGVCCSPEASISKARSFIGRKGIPPSRYGRRRLLNFLKTKVAEAVDASVLPNDRLFLPRKVVRSTHELFPGDHIEYPCGILKQYDEMVMHHLIVADKPSHGRFSKIIHFRGQSTHKFSAKYEPNIAEEEINIFKKHVAFRIVYTDRVHPEKGLKVLKEMFKLSKLKNMQKQEKVKYKLYTNNCEHLITNATVGHPISVQVEAKIHKLLQCHVVVKTPVSVATSSSLTHAAVQGAIHTGIEAADDIVLYPTLEMGLVATVDSSVLIGVAGGVAVGIGLFIEGPQLAYSIYKLHRKRKFHMISDNEYKKRVGREVIHKGSLAVGGVCGAVIGQALIPVPVVGAVVGAISGTMIGIGVGEAAGAIFYKHAFEDNKPTCELGVTTYTYYCK